jgi:hypothetical protein
MGTFDESVLDNMVTGKGLRSPIAGNIIAALRHAVDYSSPPGPNSLTREEVGILRCLLARMEGRVDPPEEDDSPAFCGTVGLLGWLFTLILAEPEVARIDPPLRELVARLNREYQAFLKSAYRRTAQAPAAAERPGEEPTS